MTPLASLLAAVEANKWPQANIGSDDQINGVPIDIWRDGRNAFSGSTDAAISLCEAMLPGLPIKLTDMSPDWLGAHGWCAEINWPDINRTSAYNPDPARALFIATLRALVAMEETS